MSSELESETHSKNRDIMQTTYSGMAHKLETRQPFTGSSVGANLITDKVTGDYEYQVFSYNTLIAKDTNGALWINPTKYSSTTSRIQNLIKKVWAI
jgi:hypothetical protein